MVDFWLWSVKGLLFDLMCAVAELSGNKSHHMMRFIVMFLFLYDNDK